jgi:hypothetical protein
MLLNCRIWLATKSGARCRLIVDCPYCYKPAEVVDPHLPGPRPVVCLIECKKRKDVEITKELQVYWERHRSNCDSH